MWHLTNEKAGYMSIVFVSRNGLEENRKNSLNFKIIACNRFLMLPPHWWHYAGFLPAHWQRYQYDIYT
jgi:hypothetical protein